MIHVIPKERRICYEHENGISFRCFSDNIFLLGACGNDNADKAKEDNKAESSMHDKKSEWV